MKKILLGLLIVAGLTACSSSEEKVDLQALNETVTAQSQEIETLQADTEALKAQVEEINGIVEESK